MLRRNERSVVTGALVRGAVVRPGTRARAAQPVTGRRARRAWRRVGGAWRSGRRQDRPARLCGRGWARVSDCPHGWGRGRYGTPVRGGAAAVLFVPRAYGPPPAAPARGAWRRVRTQYGAGAESVLGRTGGPRPACRGRRAAATRVCR